MRHALVTGGAGFIGSHVADRLLAEGWRVTALDNFDPFYPRTIKERNVAPHARNARYRIVDVDIADGAALRAAVPEGADVCVHLAAKVGVRPSLVDPVAFQRANVAGTQNLLELARDRGIGQFVFGSSSSVYGINPRVPWREDDHVLRPISPYASSKISGELLGHVYSHLYRIRFVALRFFTVYGPRQRPDLAIHKFASLMNEGRALPVYGDGSTRRDYTFVGDIVDGVRAAMDFDGSAYEVINLGNDRTVSLSEMIATLEGALGTRARIERLPEQPGDVPQTWASVEKARALLGYMPCTPFSRGVEAFVAWRRTVEGLPVVADHPLVRG